MLSFRPENGRGGHMERAPRRHIQHGIQHLPAGNDPPRHQHAEAYATIVLEGRYEQLAYAGHLRVGSGDVLIQPTFDCHFDWMKSRGIWILRLPWPQDTSFGGVYRRLAIDEIISAARKDVRQATQMLRKMLSGHAPCAPAVDDSADLLAVDLQSVTRIRIADWAAHRGISREHLSRGFAATYGVAPVRFRLELCARAAWRRIVESNVPLAAIAQEIGFSDQPHMSRAVSWLTGASPTTWRRARAGPAPPGAPYHICSRPG
jgi:AraC-like DNA-binding protein